MRAPWSGLCLSVVLAGVVVAQEGQGSGDSPAPAAKPVETVPAETAAQEKAPDLATLVGAVRAAHRGERTAPIDKFKSALRITPVRAEQDIQIDVEATFLSPRFLRFKVEEASEVLEKGWDDRGPWARVNDKIENLADRVWEKDRNEVKRQVSLARQLVDFLDPTSVLVWFAPDTVPTREELALGKTRVACDVVAGAVDSFPLFAPPEGVTDPRSTLRVWFDAQTHRLLAVLATPLDAEGAPIGAGEFLLLQDYKEQASVAVPGLLLVYSGMPGAGGRLTWKVAIRGIDVAPDGVSIETMRRPSR